MIQSYKIHINDNTVFLESEAHWQFRNYVLKEKELLITFTDEEQIKQIIEDVYTRFSGHTFYIIAEDLSRLKVLFFSQFKLIIAGGGVVFNKEHEMLLIFRNGYWDLPKGKIEMGEIVKDGAAREVKEETGVKVKSITQKIGCTYHTYNIENKRMLKETHWFMMQGKSNSVLKPQTKEGIEKVEWVKEENMHAYLSQAYSNIVDVIHKAWSIFHTEQGLF